MHGTIPYKLVRRHPRACAIAGLAVSVSLSGAIGACGSDSSPSSTEDAGSIVIQRPDGDTAANSRPVISAGAKHVCAIGNAGTLRCWGSNKKGELGNPMAQDLADGGYTFDDQPVGLPMSASVGAVARVASGSGVDYNSTCAVLTNGQVQCWGDDGAGALGRGDTSASAASRPHPEAMAVVGMPSSESVATNSTFSCAVSLGRVRCWGHNAQHTMWTSTGADGTFRSPVDIALPEQHTATQLALGQEHACVVLDDARVACWGNNGSGQLGVAVTTTPISQPGIVPSLNGVAEVAGGELTTCVRMVAGQVQCFGSNEYGLLGREVDQTALASDAQPAAVHLPPGSVVTQLAMGYTHACALLSDGSVWCWGVNYYGELGSGQIDGTSGTFQPRTSGTPLKVQGLPTTAVQVSAGNEFTCAVLLDNSVMCWGDDFWGDLGQGTPGGSAPHPVPAKVKF